jgi:flagella basal body P-ring formation protein FlgA
MNVMNGNLSPIRFVLAVGLATLLLGLATAAFADEAQPGVGDAIVHAVRERLRADVHVRLEELRVSVGAHVAAGGIRAMPDLGARLGQGVRFTLWAGDRRIGSAVARVLVNGESIVASRALARGDAITPADVRRIAQDLPDIPLRRLPEMADVIGSRLRRDVAAGEVLTSALVQIPAAVRSGDEVTVTVTVGTVAVASVGRASGSGMVGDVIRVTPRGTKAMRRARIVAAGAVEILQ